MMINKKMKIGLAIGLIAIALFFVIRAHDNNDNISAEDVAKCLTSKGIKMYGSITCSHCKEQKEIFGDAFQYIDYIECTIDGDLCKDLIGVPAWGIDGKIYYGAKSLNELKSSSGC